MTPHTHTVLVVDDDDDARRALVFYLETVGYQTAGAADGTEALRRLREGLAPCSLVVDVRMPGMDGWQLLAAVKEDPALATIPIVMLTGTPQHAERAVRFGVETYFTKPTDPGGIAAAIAKHCPHRGD